MPANLTPQYYEVERQYREAKTDKERLTLLKKMLAIMPKHKGTDKLQADLKRKISRLRQDMQKAKKTGKSSYTHHVPREGEAQIFLAGAPNSGKSSLLAAVSNAKVDIAAYPYSTRIPQPGMLVFENIQFQLVDMPPVSSEYMEKWVPAVMRNGDGCLFIVDCATDEMLEQTELVLDVLEQHHLLLSNDLPADDDPPGSMRMKTILIASHADVPGSDENFALLQELYGSRFPVIPFSTEDSGEGIDIARELYTMLDLMRVYSRTRWRKPDFSQPVVLPKKSTVESFARVIHKELAVNMKFARVWGENKIDGQQVQKDFELDEGDVVEIHLK